MRPGILVFAFFIGSATASYCQHILPHRHALPLAPMDAKAAANREQVKKPTPMTEQEMRVIHSLGDLAGDRLAELLRVYEKTNNEAMMLIVARELLKRNPRQPDALRVSDALSSDD